MNRPLAGSYARWPGDGTRPATTPGVVTTARVVVFAQAILWAFFAVVIVALYKSDTSGRQPLVSALILGLVAATLFVLGGLFARGRDGVRSGVLLVEGIFVLFDLCPRSAPPSTTTRRSSSRVSSA